MQKYFCTFFLNIPFFYSDSVYGFTWCLHESRKHVFITPAECKTPKKKIQQKILNVQLQISAKTLVFRNNVIVMFTAVFSNIFL